jgi:hypothetical protein
MQPLASNKQGEWTVKETQLKPEVIDTTMHGFGLNPYIENPSTDNREELLPKSSALPNEFGQWVVVGNLRANYSNPI